MKNKKLFIALGVIGLAVAGYFAYNKFIKKQEPQLPTVEDIKEVIEEIKPSDKPNIATKPPTTWNTLNDREVKTEGLTTKVEASNFSGDYNE